MAGRQDAQRRSERSGRSISELYNYASRNPALSVLGLVAELSHKPICLYQAEGDPFPEPDIQAAANEHGEGVVVSASGRNSRATEQAST